MEMVKAYDLKVLVAKFKARGLDVAEDMALGIIDDTFDWTQESAVISKNPYDDMLVVVIPVAKKAARAAADKIDGKEG